MLNSFALKALLKDAEFESLRSFFREIWREAANETKTGYRYVVFFAQKCQGLNLVFLAQELESVRYSDMIINKLELDCIRDSKFLTQDGLILKAKELTDAFIENGHFPRILVVDELAIYGRDFNEFMYSLESAVLEVWKQETDNVLTDDDYYSIHHQLTAAVDFVVYRFAKNRRNRLDKPNMLLLDNRLGSCIKGTFKWMESDEWCSFAQLLSKGLYYDYHIENSAFLPTFICREEIYDRIKYHQKQDDSFRWIVNRWRYHGRNLWIWCDQNVDQASTSGLAPYFACKKYEDEIRGCVHITPYLFLDNLTADSMNRLFKCFLDYFTNWKSPKFNYFSKVFRAEYNSLNNVKLKLSISLLSVLQFFDFLDDANQIVNYRERDWPEASECGKSTRERIRRICESFGGVNSAYDNYLDFCEYTLRNRDEARLLKSHLIGILREESSTTAISGYTMDTQNGKDAYMLQAEDYFWHIDIIKHKQINKKIEENSRFSGKASYRLESGLYDYLSSFGVGFQSITKKLSALVVLFEHGIVGNDISCQTADIHYLKVGESVTHIASQHLYRFIPALITLERNCILNGLIYQVWAGRFGAYINRCQPDRNTNYEELFWKFADSMYLCGYRIEDWNIGDVFELDIPCFTNGAEVRTLKEWNGNPWDEREQTEFSKMDRDNYITWELKKQEEYRNMVFSFFAETEKQKE